MNAEPAGVNGRASAAFCRRGVICAMFNGWLRKFDVLIEASDGTRLTTLREAVACLAKTVPKSEQDMPASSSKLEDVPQEVRFSAIMFSRIAE
jgi:hypothetical protein